ncbi:Hpt domain-containing protein [Rheinheimera sp. FR7-31]|uniref:Hpt domain-containing protein n=1 Tax=Rheinheimera fenheensis TaxID=3152295 RepID=UPI00325EBA04
MQVLNKNTFNTVLNLSVKHQPAMLKMLRNLLSAAQTTSEQLRFCARQHQQELLVQALHKLRGAYATIGAEQLAHQCRQLEQALENGAGIDITGVDAIIVLLHQTCDEIQAALPQVENTLSGPGEDIDLKQLYTMLKQHNMRACTVITEAQHTLQHQLPAQVAQALTQHIADLNFDVAATLLEPYLLTTDKSDC